MNRNMRVRQVGFDSSYTSWHTINRNMILFVHSGSGSIISQERSYPITAGCLCFVGANKFYYTLPDEPEAYVRSKVFLSGEALEKALSLFPEQLQMKERFTPEGMVYAQISPETAKKLAGIFDELQKSAHPEQYQDALVFSTFLQLLVTLNENTDQEMFFPASNMVQTAVEYINSHIQEDIGTEQICSLLHVSKSYFCRKFKQSTGLTVMSYILKTRIVSAKNMMEDQNLSVGQISQKCGFSSQSYFCRVFKEECGISPLQYQKQLIHQHVLKNRRIKK